MSDTRATIVTLHDPVCGMEVPGDGLHLTRDGTVYAFCEDTCMEMFVADPGRWSPGFQHHAADCGPVAAGAAPD